MPLVTSKQLIQAAAQGNYAVGAFNAVNMETAQAIIRAAEEEESPLILQVTQTTMDYTDPEELAAMIFVLAHKTSIPMAVHLDHGRTFEIVMRFLRLGFTSVMIDGSLQPDGKSPRTYEENVEITRKAVEAAHALGVSVEAEIGRLGQIGAEITEEEKALTEPDEAAKFVAETGVDMLAVAIGTTHGLYRGVPKIDHERLQRIREAIDIPLVMHGGTGVPDEAVTKAIPLGIRKINIDTQMRVAFYDSIRDIILSTEKQYAELDELGQVRKYDIRKLLGPAREAVKESVRNRIRIFGSSGRA